MMSQWLEKIPNSIGFFKDSWDSEDFFNLLVKRFYLEAFLIWKHSAVPLRVLPLGHQRTLKGSNFSKNAPPEILSNCFVKKHISNFNRYTLRKWVLQWFFMDSLN